SATAHAADLRMPMKAAPPPVAITTWTGFYIGINGGYSWGRPRTAVGFVNPVTGAAIVPPPGSVLDNPFNMDSGVAGGQIGYNWQASPSWVLGIEADIQWSGQRGDGGFTCAAVAIVGGACLPGATALLPAAAGGTVLTLDQKLEWFGTVRGRVGF